MTDSNSGDRDHLHFHKFQDDYMQFLWDPLSAIQIQFKLLIHNLSFMMFLLPNWPSSKLQSWKVGHFKKTFLTSMDRFTLHNNSKVRELFLYNCSCRGVSTLIDRYATRANWLLLGPLSTNWSYWTRQACHACEVGAVSLIMYTSSCLKLLSQLHQIFQ